MSMGGGAGGALGLVHRGGQVLATMARHQLSIKCSTGTLKGQRTRPQVANHHEEVMFPTTSAQTVFSLAKYTPRGLRNRHSGEQSGVTHRNHHVLLGVPESNSDSSVSFDSIGTEALPASPSSTTGSSELRLVNQVGIDVVNSLEEVENKIPTAATARHHGDFPTMNPRMDDICLPGERNLSWPRPEPVRLDQEINEFLEQGQVISPHATLEVEFAQEHDVATQLPLLKPVKESAAAVASTEVADASRGPAGDTLTVPTMASVEGKKIIEQLREIILFAGPAMGIWMFSPVMSLIDTSVIGNSSSLELAALGPGTVLCDHLSYVFMFLSVATSNLIATSLAQQDEAGAAHHLSRLLFVSLVCGVAMLLIMEFGVTSLLQAFVGVKNASLIPAARTYVKIRALAWPAVLVCMVAQSASLGMQDSWGPLKVLAISSLVNFSGDIFLCTFLGYGIAGAAWATMASQYVAGFLMLVSLNWKGYNALAIAAPSWTELMHIAQLAVPVLLTNVSKVMFYMLMTYLVTSLGATTLAAHQVMIGIYSLCGVWGEPLGQTAQAFMPALIHGPKHNLKQARILLRSLMVIGVVIGLLSACLAASIPWFFPQVFTGDIAIINHMRMVTLPFLCGLMMTPPTSTLEGTLLAGRDLKFLVVSMASSFCGASLLLLIVDRLGFGLQGIWWILAAFRWIRLMQSYLRLVSPWSVLADRCSSSAVDSTLHLKTA